MERKLITGEWLDSYLPKNENEYFTSLSGDRKLYEYWAHENIIVQPNDDNTYSLCIKFFDGYKHDTNELRKVKYQDEVELAYNFLNEGTYPSKEMIAFAEEFARWLNNSKVQFHLLPIEGETAEKRLWKREELMRIFLNEEYGQQNLILPAN